MNTGFILSNVRDALDQARDHVNADEIAIVFPTPNMLTEFVEKVTYESGVHRLEHFNSVQRDLMTRQDVPETFNVRFEFLRRRKDLMNWRIEAMCVLDGNAPLHAAALEESGGRPAVIHASYKLGSPIEYEEEKLRLVQSEGREMVAEYANSYGMFSYYNFGLPFYVKPRVNLRDS